MKVEIVPTGVPAHKFRCNCNCGSQQNDSRAKEPRPNYRSFVADHRLGHVLALCCNCIWEGRKTNPKKYPLYRWMTDP